MNIVTRATTGFASPFNGLQTIFSSKKIFILTIIPFLIGVVLVASGFVLASQYLMPWLDSWLQGFDWIKNYELVFSVVSGLFFLFAWLAAGLANFLVGYLGIILIGGPFYALLSEEIFRRDLGEMLKGSSLRLMVSMFALGLMKVLLFAIVGLACLIMSFIPILNLFAAFLVFSMVSFDSMDYAFEIDQLSLRARFHFFFKHFWEFAGVTGAIALISLVPGLFFVIFPAFVAGSTNLYIQLSQKSL